ncbi:MAG: hypothetical protein WCS94_15725 [Verrucomicrobiota bacterium]
MKLSTEWKKINRDQRRAWNAWAKSNPVLLDDGSFRRVSAHKAMTMVLRNRTVAGDALNPTVVPAAAPWLDGAFSVRDAGATTVGVGYIGFRVEQNIPDGTKWFVWASKLVLADEAKPLSKLQFLGVMAPGALTAADGGDVTPSLGAQYLAVHGDWHPPVVAGVYPPVWNPSRYIWFRVHQYRDGQLSPGRVLSTMVYYEV